MGLESEGRVYAGIRPAKLITYNFTSLIYLSVFTYYTKTSTNVTKIKGVTVRVDHLCTTILLSLIPTAATLFSLSTDQSRSKTKELSDVVLKDPLLLAIYLRKDFERRLVRHWFFRTRSCFRKRLLWAPGLL